MTEAKVRLVQICLARRRHPGTEMANAVGLCHRMCGNADLAGATGAALASRKLR